MVPAMFETHLQGALPAEAPAHKVDLSGSGSDLPTQAILVLCFDPAQCKCCTSSRKTACLLSEKQDSAADATEQWPDFIVKPSEKARGATRGSMLHAGLQG